MLCGYYRDELDLEINIYKYIKELSEFQGTNGGQREKLGKGVSLCDM